MSIQKRVTVTCPKCGKPFQVIIFASINANHADNVADQIMDGSFFHGKCPACGFVANLAYDVFYHDEKHSTMIWLIHKDGDYEKKVAEICAVEPPPQITTRLVRSVNELREKVACLEANRDDRIIELVKLFTLRGAEIPENIEQQVVAFYAFYREQNAEVIELYTEKGRLPRSYTVVDNYKKLEKAFGDTLLREITEVYPVVDINWAMSFLTSHMDLLNEKTSIDEEENSIDEASSCTGNGEVLFCRKCGTKLLENAMFCHRCGADVLLK